MPRKREGHPSFPSPGRTSYKYDKTGDPGPQNYEYMSELQANLIQDKRIKNQIKNRKRQTGS